MSEIVTLPGGLYSLEFAESQLDALGTFISAVWGKPHAIRHAICTEYEFGGCCFTFYNEWNEPCLIANSDAGRAILARINAHLHDLL